MSRKKIKKITYDDFALLELLRSKRDPTSVRLLTNQFTDFFITYCAETGIDTTPVLPDFTAVFLKFKVGVETGKIRQPLNGSVWELLLKTYQTDEALTTVPFKAENSRFLPRRIITDLLESKDDLTQRAVEKTFRGPARRQHETSKLAWCSTFEETYSSALESLFKKPPGFQADQPALLYTFFCTLLNRRAYDLCQQNDSESKPEQENIDFDVIIKEVECHNSQETVDYIIEAHNLGELAGTDNGPAAVSWLLAKLGGTCEELLTAFYIKGWSYDAIGERTSIKATSVGTTKDRCIDKLTDLLANLKNGSDE